MKMDDEIQTGTVIKPIRNWCRVVYKVGCIVVVRHVREDFRTCTIQKKDGTGCYTGVPLDRIKINEKIREKRNG